MIEERRFYDLQRGKLDRSISGTAYKKEGGTGLF